MATTVRTRAMMWDACGRTHGCSRALAMMIQYHDLGSGCGTQGSGSLASAVTGQNYHLRFKARCYGIFIPDSVTQLLLQIQLTAVRTPTLRSRCIERYSDTAT